MAGGSIHPLALLSNRPELEWQEHRANQEEINEESRKKANEKAEVIVCK